MIIFHNKNKKHPDWINGGSQHAIYRWERQQRNGIFYSINGERIELFRVKQLAEVLDRLPRTIIEWEQMKMFPKPTVRMKPNAAGHYIRYYTSMQLLNLHQCWAFRHKARGKFHNSEEFRAMLSDFRTIMEAKYYNKYIVCKDGSIDPSKHEENKARVERGIEKPQ